MSLDSVPYGIPLGILEGAIDALILSLAEIERSAELAEGVDGASFALVELHARDFRTDLARVSEALAVENPASLDSLAGLITRMGDNRDFANDLFEMETALRATGYNATDLSSFSEALSQLSSAYRTALEFAQRAGSSEQELQSILPAQKAAPLRFRVDDDVLRLQHVRDQALPEVAAAADAARQQLETLANMLLDNLRRSNTDRRVVEMVEQMRERLSSTQDIVQLAVTNISAGLMFETVADEMANSLASSLRGFSLGVTTYVAQFPEWQRFADNAASLELSQAEVEEVLEGAAKLAGDLAAAGPQVDPEVPKSISFLIDLVRRPAPTSKRAAFAVVRTVENLVASVFQYCGALVGSTVDGAKGGVKKAAYIAVLVAALEVASRVSPIASKLIDGKWMKPAVEIVKKELGEAIGNK